MAEPLLDLVATLQERVKELRRSGDAAALLAAANTAADQIEHRVGEPLTEVERQALTAVQRFTFNAAADCWPGWSVPDRPSDTANLVVALELARRSLRLVRKLHFGPMQEGTGIWLCGAFELALGRNVDASDAFALARHHHEAARAPGLVLLMEGYIAIVRQGAGDQLPAGGEDLTQIITRMAAGGFEDGAEWTEQLRTALKVFAL